MRLCYHGLPHGQTHSLTFLLFYSVLTLCYGVILLANTVFTVSGWLLGLPAHYVPPDTRPTLVVSQLAFRRSKANMSIKKD